jgi:hypothetical protein
MACNYQGCKNSNRYMVKWVEITGSSFDVDGRIVTDYAYSCNNLEHLEPFFELTFENLFVPDEIEDLDSGEIFKNLSDILKARMSEHQLSIPFS